uniref:Uncharacterized protein n=1 Tax=Macrostomum lignano TaxID=282301 RepID=A0A1I8FVN7_9PLAT
MQTMQTVVDNPKLSTNSPGTHRLASSSWHRPVTSCQKFADYSAKLANSQARIRICPKRIRRLAILPPLQPPRQRRRWPVCYWNGRACWTLAMPKSLRWPID